MDKMNNNVSADFDVERNKELFEYEMTEVLINFKKELNQISAAETSVDASGFDVPKVSIEIKCDDIEVEPIKLSNIADLPDNFGEKCKISPVTVKKADIDTGKKIPVSLNPVLSDVEVEKTKVKIPSIPQISIGKPQSVSVDDIEIKNINVNTHFNFDISKISSPTKLESVKKTGVDISGVSKLADKIKTLEVNTNNKGNKMFMPKITGLKDFKPAEVSLEKVESETVVVNKPNINADIPCIAIEGKAVNYREIHVSEFKIPEVDKQVVKISEPVELPDVSEYIADILKSVNG